MGGKGGSSGGDQAAAATEAAQIQADAQREALEYLKETEAIPQQYREDALKQLGSIYGVGGDTSGQQAIIDQAQNSPLYNAIMGTQEAGEDAILRQQAQTGGLRSGDTQSNLYGYNQQLQNKALLDSYNQQVSGISSLAGLPSNANQIASLTQGIGTTTAQGITGAAAAEAQGSQQGFSNLLGLAGTGIAAYGAFSDPRLKTNIRPSETIDGINFYTWDWNETAGERLGLYGSDEGVLTNEHPDCVMTHESGYKMIDYRKIKAKVEAHG